MLTGFGEVFVLVFGLGPLELLVVGVVALIIFGNRLPEVARSLGKGVVEFRKGLREIEDDIEREPSKKTEEIGYDSSEPIPSPKQEVEADFDSKN